MSNLTNLKWWLSDPRDVLRRQAAANETRTRRVLEQELPETVRRRYHRVEDGHVEFMIRNLTLGLAFLMAMLPSNTSGESLAMLAGAVAVATTLFSGFVVRKARAWLGDVFARSHRVLADVENEPGEREYEATAQAFVTFRRLANQLVATGFAAHLAFAVVGGLLMPQAATTIMVVTFFVAGFTVAVWRLRFRSETVREELVDAYAGPLDAGYREGLRDRLEEIRLRNEGSWEARLRPHLSLTTLHDVFSTVLCIGLVMGTAALLIGGVGHPQTIAIALSWGAGLVGVSFLSMFRRTSL